MVKLRNDEMGLEELHGEGKIGNEGLTQNYVGIVRQLHQELIREKTKPLSTGSSHRNQKEKRETQVQQLDTKALSGSKNSIPTAL